MNTEVLLLLVAGVAMVGFSVFVPDRIWWLPHYRGERKVWLIEWIVPNILLLPFVLVATLFLLVGYREIFEWLRRKVCK